MLVGGLIYAMARQMRQRRLLPADRYRGPSIVLLLALAMVLATAASVPFAADAEALLGGEGDLSPTGAIVILTSLQVVLLLLSWLFVLRPGALRFARPLFGARPLRAAGLGVGGGVLAWVAALALTLAIVAVLERVGIPYQPQPVERVLARMEPWVVIVAAVVVAPVAEEVFFRGVAFNAWLRERGRRVGYIGSSLLFAVVHVSLVLLVPIFLLGLALAWIYRRTGSLLAPIAMHATFNGIETGIALLVRFEVIRPPV